MSEFFKKLKLHELLQVQINSKLNKKKCMVEQVREDLS